MAEPSARENAVAIYELGIRDGDPAAAMARTGARYTQHSTGVPDGQEGFLAFFAEFLARNPIRDIRVVRVLQDGPLVFLQAFQSLNDGRARWATADIFDSDAEGRIIEHWDVIEEFVPANPAGRSNLDGPSEVTDLQLTEANRQVVMGLFERHLLAARSVGVDALLAPDLAQHAPSLPDGREAFVATWAGTGAPWRFVGVEKVVAEGNFVAVMSRASDRGVPQCRIDLFRLADGRVVEQWCQTEPLPAAEDLTNSGKF